MSNIQIQIILQRHGVTSICNGSQIQALDEYTIQGVQCGKWIDVTGYSARELRNFLGYDNIEDQIIYN